jgi:hypothetical protein
MVEYDSKGTPITENKSSVVSDMKEYLERPDESNAGFKKSGYQRSVASPNDVPDGYQRQVANSSHGGNDYDHEKEESVKKEEAETTDKLKKFGKTAKGYAIKAGTVINKTAGKVYKSVTSGGTPGAKGSGTMSKITSMGANVNRNMANQGTGKTISPFGSTKAGGNPLDTMTKHMGKGGTIHVGKKHGIKAGNPLDAMTKGMGGSSVKIPKQKKSANPLNAMTKGMGTGQVKLPKQKATANPLNVMTKNMGTRKVKVMKQKPGKNPMDAMTKSMQIKPKNLKNRKAKVPVMKFKSINFSGVLK